MDVPGRLDRGTVTNHQLDGQLDEPARARAVVLEDEILIEVRSLEVSQAPDRTYGITPPSRTLDSDPRRD